MEALNNSVPFVSFSDFESLDEDTQVVATARGKFTSQGGVLSSPESGVSIVIPEGAIPKGVEQEIYFKVCKDNNFMPPLDSDRGNRACFSRYRTSYSFLLKTGIRPDKLPNRIGQAQWLLPACRY